MAIRVAHGTAQAICDLSDGFVIQLRDPSSIGAAATAMRRARADVLELAAVSDLDDPEGPVVSPVVLGPDGPLVRFARLNLSDDLLRTIPDLLVRRLEDANVESGIIECPEPGGLLDGLDHCANAVVLRVFPAPAGTAGVLPPQWLDVACEWALGDLNPHDRVAMRLLAIEYEIEVSEAPAVVHQCGVGRAWCDVVNGHLDDKVRTASVTFGRAPHVALAAGGPSCDSHALLARYELLQEVARELAGEVAYACLDIEATFEGVGLGLATTGWRAQGGASPNLVVGELCDLLVPDAFPYQILGRGHLERLAPGGADIDDPPIGEPIGSDRIELQIEEPGDWLPIYDARDAAQANGWELLAACLATDAEAHELLEGRPRRDQIAADAEDATLSDTSAPGTLDLSTITLETLPHARRGLRLTLLELVSWLGHEPHSDNPPSVSPVLATYARWFASGLDDDHRQELKSRAAGMVATATATEQKAKGGPPQHLAPVDSIRAWAAADWLVRVQAPAWLRLAGLTEAATRLESLGSITDNLELVRAVDVLGSAITIAGRRIDITSSIAGTERDEDSSVVEQAAWDAWEEASELSGWIAASEAAGVGVPSELSYAADLRVIECSRDAHARDELESSRKTVGDSAWATALHAVADQAWTMAWSAADEATAGVGTIDLRTAIDRSTRAAFDRLGTDDDQRETLFEAAESAARDSLTRAALRGGSWEAGEHPWDAARRAARSSSGGQAWGTIMDMARDAVDESAWESAMAAARSATDEVLHDAPDMVARTVAAAVAREAASSAARGVALRAAAVSRAHGADPGRAADAAIEALAGTLEDLRDSAMELLDQLIEAKPPLEQSVSA